MRQTDYGIELETPVLLPGGASKNQLIDKFVIGGGIKAATGAQGPSIKVPALV